MGAEAVLAEMGYRPKGSNSGNFLNKMVLFMQQQQDTQKKLQDEQKKKADMYQTLREAGYDSKSAYDAAMKGTMPSEAGGETLKEQQAKLEMGKTTAETAKINAEMGILPEQKAERQARTDKLQAEIAKINQDMQGSTDILDTKEKQSKIDKLQAEITKISKETSLLGTKQTDSQKFREALQQARKGEIDWEDVKQDWPERADTVDKIKKQLESAGILNQPVAKQPIKQVKPFQLIARMKPEYATMNPQTQAIVSKIKTNQDLLNFVKNADKLEQRGVDVEALQDYYAKEINDLITQGLVKEK